jgi:hypothetical protein
MTGKTGDRIRVETERVGQGTREGTILEVTETEYSVNYRVRWDDGHESEFRPAAGSATIIPASEQVATGRRR